MRELLFGQVAGIATGIASFGIWILCIAANPLLGALLGWIPALICALVVGSVLVNLGRALKFVRLI